MNVFVRGTVATGARVLHEKIKADMKSGAGKFVIDVISGLKGMSGDWFRRSFVLSL